MHKIIGKLIFYTIFCIFITFNLSAVDNQKIIDFLKTIPKEEKEDLEMLFQDLFNLDNFSYTLFGNKPLSLTAHFTTSFDDEGIPQERGVNFWNKWKLWKKYAQKFPIKHYILIEVSQKISNRKEIYFFNKKCCIEKINKHIKLFRKIFGKSITGSILIEKFEKDPKFISILRNQQILLGILLGYGEHNARLFDKRNQISYFVYKKEFPKAPVKIPTPSKEFSTLQDEFNSYFSTLTPFGDRHYSPLIIRSVFFVADHTHPETIDLQKKYRKMRGQISAIYSKGNFLEITLSKLTED